MIRRYRERCTPEKRKECEAANGPWLEQICKDCPGRDVREYPYLDHLLWLHTLQRSGYPFSADMLPLETWEDLGELKHLLSIGDQKAKYRRPSR